MIMQRRKSRGREGGTYYCCFNLSSFPTTMSCQYVVFRMMMKGGRPTYKCYTKESVRMKEGRERGREETHVLSLGYNTDVIALALLELSTALS